MGFHRYKTRWRETSARGSSGQRRVDGGCRSARKTEGELQGQEVEAKGKRGGWRLVARWSARGRRGGVGRNKREKAREREGHISAATRVRGLSLRGCVESKRGTSEGERADRVAGGRRVRGWKGVGWRRRGWRPGGWVVGDEREKTRGCV